MKLSITGKHIDIGDTLRERASAELSAIAAKYFDDAVEASAVFSKETRLFRSDLAVHAGRDLVVKATGTAPDAYAALQDASQKLVKQLRRSKQRLREGRRVAAVAKITPAKKRPRAKPAR